MAENGEADYGLQAWDGEARTHQLESGKELVACRDDLIVVWLMRYGDARPYVDWVLRGHTPGPAVMQLLAQMLHPVPRQAPYGEKLKFGFRRYEKGSAVVVTVNGRSWQGLRPRSATLNLGCVDPCNIDPETCARAACPAHVGKHQRQC